MRNWLSPGPPGSAKNTIVFVMKIKIVYFLGLKKANTPRSDVGPVPAGIRACLLFFLRVPKSGDPEARVSWGPLAERHTQETVKFSRSSAPWPSGPLTARGPRGGAEDKPGGHPAQSPTQGDLSRHSCQGSHLPGDKA